MLSETCLRSANVKAASEGVVCLSLDRRNYREVLEDTSNNVEVRRQSVMNVLHQKQRKREITHAKHEGTRLIKNRRKSNTSFGTPSPELLAQIEAEVNGPSGEDSRHHGEGSEHHGEKNLNQRKVSTQISDFLSVDLSLNSKVRGLLFPFQPTSCPINTTSRFYSTISLLHVVFTL
jgi:hypothetical protein